MAVYTCTKRQSICPSWARPLLTLQSAPAAQRQLHGSDGKDTGLHTDSPAPLGATGRIDQSNCATLLSPVTEQSVGQPPQHAVKFAEEVDLRVAEFHGKRIAVIGGGMTAAHLALGALERGAATVLLIARSPVTVQEFACTPGWTGSKLLAGFKEVASWQVRELQSVALRESLAVKGTV